jgi:hypothetical protein
MLPALGTVQAPRAGQPPVNPSGHIVAAFELRLHNSIVADNAGLASVSCRTGRISSLPVWMTCKPLSNENGFYHLTRHIGQTIVSTL